METPLDARDTLVERLPDGSLRLLAPAPGLFTCVRAQGEVLVGGGGCGVLLALGRGHLLRVPAGIEGRVRSSRPERVLAPVGYGDLLYELSPLAAGSPVEAPPEAAAATAAAGLSVRAPHGGRFYQRPAPGAEAFVAAGDRLEDGRPVGLIEVMKTFTHVPYRATGGLPQRARVVRWLVGDGEDVLEGAPLLEVEPA